MILEHINFLDDSVDIGTVIGGEYDPWLVVLSISIAVLASYAALGFSISSSAKNSNLKNFIWTFSAAVAQGLGIWSMHFIAMLAYQVPMEVRYDSFITVVSVVPAIVASFIVLKTDGSSRVSWGGMFLRAVLMAAGIGTMHFIGMAAMEIDARMYYEPMLFVSALVITVALSAVALNINQRATRVKGRFKFSGGYLIVSAVLMGAAIAAMHYTAMLSLYIIPHDYVGLEADIVVPVVLAITIAIIVAVIITLLMVSVHMSHRAMLMELLQESDEKHRAIIENSGDGIITIDSRGVVESFNRAAERIFQYSAGEVIGKNIALLLPEGERGEHERYVERSELYESRVINTNRDLEARRRDGKLIPVELNVTPMRVRDRLSFVGVVRDISNRKEAERALHQARIDAECANHAKDEFLTRMSHELRTPLNAILGFGQLLQMDDDGRDKDHTEGVGHIMIAGQHLLQLVNEVLDISKVDANEMEFTIEDVALTQEIDSAIAITKPLLDQNGITVKGEWDCALSVRVDVLRLRQVLLNMLSNAIKYNRDKGEVEILLTVCSGDNVRISIADNGVGISEADISAVFDPFKQIEQQGKAIEGTGVGLSITKKLVEAMGGRIGVESELGKGSTFWFELPRVIARHVDLE